MQLLKKKFQELNTEELYEILAARAKIFVVEQASAYLDPDGLDQEALHVYFWDDKAKAGEKVRAYLRLFIYKKEAKIVALGRMLSRDKGQGVGRSLLREGIKLAKETMGADSIYLEGQCQAVGFYQKEGFQVKSEKFLIDGIAHVKMEKRLI